MRVSHTSRSFGGYTMIEIVIVLAMLGILAAIVIPEFTQVHSRVRRPGLASMLQTLRRQVQSYKLEHGGALPNLAAGWVLNDSTVENSSSTFGPHMPNAPVNPENGASNVIDSAAGPGATVSRCGFVYDYSGGSGQIYGTDNSGTFVLNY